MQTQSAVSAAHLLYQSAEAKLPKQKKVLAVSEFKRAKVAHKRRSKAFRKEEFTVHLPEDVLAHIFSFLDTQSLASVGSVCWSWNAAAGNNLLWQAHYDKIFGSDSNPEGQKTTCSVPENLDSGSNIVWKEAFKTAYIAKSSETLASNRGYCNNCKAVVWLAGMECCNEANCSTRKQSKNTGVIHITSGQVVEYLLHGSSALFLPSSDSDCDSEDLTMWAYDFSSY
ncbi:F-box protein At5g52880 [Linum grandiflorum]